MAGEDRDEIDGRDAVVGPGVTDYVVACFMKLCVRRHESLGARSPIFAPYTRCACIVKSANTHVGPFLAISASSVGQHCLCIDDGDKTLKRSSMLALFLESSVGSWR